MSLMVVFGSLVGALGAIATHLFLDNPTSAPAAHLSVTPPQPAPNAPASVSSSPIPHPIPSATATTAISAAPGTAIAPEPAALASFSPVLASVSPTASGNPPNDSPLARLWTDPIQTAQAQAENIDIAYQARSGGIPPQFRGKVIYGGGLSATNTVNNTVNNKVVALTFDDGPWPETTAAVMNLLKQHGGKGTFFVVGNLVKRYPDLVKRMVDEGHEVANHTWTHRTAYSSPTIAAKEIDTTEAAIAKHTGFRTRIYRPPGGILNNGLVNYAHKKGYATLMWSTDTLDWRYRQAGSIRQRILRSLTPGGVVLMHDGGGPRWATVKALAQVLPELKAKGYRLVTVSELLWLREQQTRKTTTATAKQPGV